MGQRPDAAGKASAAQASKTERRRAREMRTVSQMICIYCAGNHDAPKTRTAFCGEPLCEACAQTDDYAVLRTRHCRNMERKTSCEACPNHCYKPGERETIRAVMRYAGPRMMTKHPVAAIRHMLGI